MIVTDVFQTMVGFEDDSGATHLCDSLEYQGGLWLVSSWLSAPDDKYRYPERIIRFDLLKHQVMPESYEARYLLNDPLPKYLFDGEMPAVTPYVVVEGPDIRVPFPEIH